MPEYGDCYSFALFVNENKYILKKVNSSFTIDKSPLMRMSQKLTYEL